MTPLDTQVEVETPEGVVLRLVPAGPVVRAVAFGVDLAIISAAYALAASVLWYLGEFGSGIALVVAFILQWLYPVLFEVLHDGQTPGKALLGIQTVHEDGTPVGLSAASVRGLLLAVDGVWLAFTIGLASMVVSRRFQRLGDLAAGTLVVYRRQYHPAAAATPGALAAPEVRALPLPLLRDEQQLVVEFAERCATLSPDRRAELADRLAGTLTPAPGLAGVDALIGFAAAIVGAGSGPAASTGSGSADPAAA